MKEIYSKNLFIGILSILLIILCEDKIDLSRSNQDFNIQFLKRNEEILKQIQTKMSGMTLREKIAQMIISSATPENIDENSKEFLKLKKLCSETKVGGFIFFKGNAEQYAKLSNLLQELSETPLLISADFERGTGMRVTDGTLFPNNMAIGATGNPTIAYQMGRMIGFESRAIGVSQNYAPVCDVNNNPENPIINVRSFGEDPILVSKMSEEMIKGLQESKVISTAKHFPGHGDTKIDSHTDLPVLNFSMDRLNSLELIPFKNAINNGVRSVMIAHLSFPELEPDTKIPASLSYNIVQNLLIDNLGFKGLVVTDALNMKGITKYFNTEEVAIMCVKAGIDLILMPIDEIKSINAIEKAVMDGKIQEDRINRSVEKILEAKQWVGLFDKKYVDVNEVIKKINTKESNDLAQKIADESITLVKDDYNIIPIKNSDDKILSFDLSEGKENINSDYYNQQLLKKFNTAEIINIDSDISNETLKKYFEMANNYNIIIFSLFAKIKYGTGKISLLPSHIDFIKSLSSINKKIIILSFGNPYLLKDIPSVPNYLCAYGDANVSITATIKALTGDIKIMGTLPISISNDYPIGTGIHK